MLSTALVLVLNQLALGEAGESCRSSADCAAPLSCLAGVCSAPSIAPPPMPTRSAPEASAPQVSTEADTDTAVPFEGTHFFIGARAGAGPAYTTTTDFMSWQQFSGLTYALPAELRLGLLFGRFELFVEGAPATLFLSRTTLVTVTAGVGVMIKLYESESFGVYLPLRARAGIAMTVFPVAALGGGSAGLGLRFGHLLAELRAGADFAGANGSSVLTAPVTLGLTWAF